MIRKKHIIVASALLFSFAAIGTGIVAYVHQVTKPVIEENIHDYMLAKLDKLVDKHEYDNNLVEDTLQVSDANALGTDSPVTVYRARRNGKPVAAILSPVAPDGYNGEIQLLVGVYYDGRLAGVRVVSHHETPGLGDKIDEERSNWILGFDDRSLVNTSNDDWAVKKDGGTFDQLTGATITPRAIVKAVHRTLIYFSEHRDELFRTSENGQ